MHFPLKFLQKRSPYFFHGALAPSLIWSRRPCVTSFIYLSLFKNVITQQKHEKATVAETLKGKAPGQ